MSDIFISYGHEDKAKAKCLAEALERQGLSVWWDPHIPPGKRFAQVIEEELYAANCVVVLWSNNSVKSEWVEIEASEGRRRGILIPVLIEDVIIPLEFKLIHAESLIDWDGKSPHAGIDNLVKAIAEILGLRSIHARRTGVKIDPNPDYKLTKKAWQEEARLKEQRGEWKNKRMKVGGQQWRWVYQNMPLLILAVAMVSVFVVIFPEVSKIAVMATELKTSLVAAILVVLAVIGAIGYILVSSAPEGEWRLVYQNMLLLILAVAMGSVLAVAMGSVFVVLFPEVSKIVVTATSKIVVTATESKTAQVVVIIVVLSVLGEIGYILISSSPEGGWTVARLIDAIKDKFQRGGRGL